MRSLSRAIDSFTFNIVAIWDLFDIFKRVPFIVRQMEPIMSDQLLLKRFVALARSLFYPWKIFELRVSCMLKGFFTVMQEQHEQGHPGGVASRLLDELAALRRDTFGFVFQRYNLLANATAAENVEIPAIYAGAASSWGSADCASLAERTSRPWRARTSFAAFVAAKRAVFSTALNRSLSVISTFAR